MKGRGFAGLVCWPEAAEAKAWDAADGLGEGALFLDRVAARSIVS